MTGFEIYGLLAAVIGFLAYIPYIKNTLNGTLKPHIFTWLQWALTMSIIFVAQLLSDAGPGAWVVGVGAVSVLVVGLLSIKNGERHITRGDWIALIVGVSTIPLWLATKDPLWSVLILTFIDGVGYIPTFRKSWPKPNEESASMFAVWVVSSLLGLMAIEEMTLINYVYLSMCAVMNAALVMMLLYRRRVLGKNGIHAA